MVRSALSHGLERASRLFGDRQAVVSDSGSRTWREESERSARLAGILQEAGVERGSRVAVAAGNCPEYLEMFYACAHIGAIVVPLNTRLAMPEVQTILDHSEPTLLAVASTVGHTIADKAVPAPKVVLDLDDARVQRRISATEPAAPVGVGEDDPVALFYTGGTTGAPKGVTLSHRNLVHNADRVLLGLGYNHQDRYLHAAPMFHIADCASTFAVTAAGGCHAFVPRFDTTEILDALDAFEITAMLLVPTMIGMLTSDATLKDHSLATWRVLFYGGAPISERIAREALDRLPCDLVQGYGMTETSPLATLLSAGEHRAAAAVGSATSHHLTSAGREVPGVRVRVCDDDGHEMPPGEPGEIVVAGANVMLGYWGDAAATSASMRGPWLRTGDVGCLDDEGYLYVLDRSKDMIITSGDNVYSIEVEQAISTHPSVLQSAVIARPDESRGESVHAIVVLRPGATLTLTELRSHCAPRLAAYKWPLTVEIREHLPMSGPGKVIKSALRSTYWSDQARRVH